MHCHRNFVYDQLNRPLGATWSPVQSQAPPTALSATFNFSYDATNRRISQTATDNSWWSYPTAATSVSYTANNLNQYTAVGAVTPSYDGNGNLTYDGSFTYGYDAENRLISASGTGLTASYAYDAQGRRKLKTVNGTTTIFVTDANNREVLEYNGTSGAIENWYAYALGPNDVLNQMNIASGTRATFIPDIQGSIIGSLDAASGSLTKFGYQTYGESGSPNSTFAYTGQRIDPETNGLYYYRARMYSPAWGRFNQVDPIGYAGGSNLYRYVANDPLNLTDPYGFAPDSPQPQAGGAGGNGGPPPDVAAAAAAEEPENNSANYVQLASMVQNPYALEQQGLFPECDLCGASGGGYPSVTEPVGTAAAGETAAVPSTLARVIPGAGPFPTLGPPESADVFVTGGEAIQGLTPAQISQSLSIPYSSTYTIIEFPTPSEGLASPVFRTNPGFVGGGVTAGGAPEFVIPNGPIPAGATTTIIGPQ